MKITSASYTTGCYGEPTKTLTISRQNDAVVAVIGGKAFRFRGVDLQEVDLNQETWEELRDLAAAIYGKGTTGRANCTNSMFRELRDTLETFA